MGGSLLRAARHAIDEFGLERVVDSDSYVSEFFLAEERLFEDSGMVYPYRRPVGSMRTRSALRIGAASDTVLLAYAQWRARALSLPAMQELLEALHAQQGGVPSVDAWIEDHVTNVRYERFGALIGRVLYTGETTGAGRFLERIDCGAFDRIAGASYHERSVDFAAARERIGYGSLLSRLGEDVRGERVVPPARFIHLRAPRLERPVSLRSE